jgi:exodeoxyribonuclease-1
MRREWARIVNFKRGEWEQVFAYFGFFGTPRIMHFLTRMGVGPNDANAQVRHRQSA